VYCVWNMCKSIVSVLAEGRKLPFGFLSVSSDSCLTFDSIVRPSVESDLICFLAKPAQRISYLMSYSTAFSLMLFFGLQNFLFLFIIEIILLAIDSFLNLK